MGETVWWKRLGFDAVDGIGADPSQRAETYGHVTHFLFGLVIIWGSEDLLRISQPSNVIVKVSDRAFEIPCPFDIADGVTGISFRARIVW